MLHGVVTHHVAATMDPYDFSNMPVNIGPRERGRCSGDPDDLLVTIYDNVEE